MNEPLFRIVLVGCQHAIEISGFTDFDANNRSRKESSVYSLNDYEDYAGGRTGPESLILMITSWEHVNQVGRVT